VNGRRRVSSWLAGAALMPPWRVVRAQAQLPRVGFLTPGSPGAQPVEGFFEQGLRELGYIDGRNIVIERRFAMGRLEALPALAAELVRLPVNVLAVSGPAPLPAAIAATQRIPIVMLASSADPVAEGLVRSLARPGGNVTGLTYAESTDRFGKQLEALKQAVPHAARVAVWWDADLAAYRRTWSAPLTAAGRMLGLEVQAPTQVLVPEHVEPALEAMKQQRADAVLVAINGPSARFAGQTAAAAVRLRLPTVAAQKSFTHAGGLLSYGPDIPALHRRGAAYVDRLLKGASAAEMPIELPSKYELVVNLKTARALGLEIPPSLRLRADEVIE
jgi:putative ABC transport system substrate-binding protein